MIDVLQDMPEGVTGIRVSGRLSGDDLPCSAGDDAIQLRHDRQDGQSEDEGAEHVHRDAHPARLRSIQDLGGFGLKQLNDLVGRRLIAPR